MAIKKKPDLNTKTGRYAIARLKTTTKKEAAIIAGMNPTNVSRVENSPSYLAIKETFKDALLRHITVDQLNARLAQIAINSEDNNSLNAIKLAKEIIEPEATPKTPDTVQVFFGPKPIDATPRTPIEEESES